MFVLRATRLLCCRTTGVASHVGQGWQTQMCVMPIVLSSPSCKNNRPCLGSVRKAMQHSPHWGLTGWQSSVSLGCHRCTACFAKHCVDLQLAVVQRHRPAFLFIHPAGSLGPPRKSHIPIVRFLARLQAMDPALSADVDAARPAPSGNADAAPQWQPPPSMDDLLDHSPIPTLVVSPTYRVVRVSWSLMRSWFRSDPPSAPDVGGADLFHLLSRNERGWHDPHAALLRHTLESAALKRSPCDMRAVLARPRDRLQWLAVRVVPVFRGDELLSFVLEWQLDHNDTTEAERLAHEWGADELVKRGCPNTVVLGLNRDGIVIRSSASTPTKLGCPSTDIVGRHWTALTGLRENEVGSRNWISVWGDPKRGFWAEVQEPLMTPIGSDEPERYERVLVIRDITDELVLERSLDVTRREAASLLSNQDSVDGTELTKLSMDAVGIVRKVVEEENRAASQRISAGFGQGIPSRFVGDPVKFAQIIRALVRNAVKFGGEGEDIFVHLDPESNDEGSMELNLSVADQGIGIGENMQDIILPHNITPYQRHTADDEPTSGLSLHLAHRAISDMGGHIRFEPNYGASKGTVFRARVKLARFPGDPPWVPPPGHQGRAPFVLLRWLTGEQRNHIEAIYPRTKILVVEDNLVCSKILERQLQRHLYGSNSARHGRP
ncbi:hypothetical protein GGTG_03566 [Gaeumannomyces tritici R3-111a-1]|uniref:histidine kinase n=1 Tax=Gaeumannomyces tritici (strain R3-111a-1) TaxID=644352 RepID=J3NQL0_GAET3|nr:hypothetical protein GGTG_03566 [Gaeumannomyces tritici R3-111a-1]EJT78466.1 hypothetical protein GGTG_03566 [Gaeumannomyces tritici R3-111a-1]